MMPPLTTMTNHPAMLTAMHCGLSGFVPVTSQM
jgi:hypothetical protein